MSRALTITFVVDTYGTTTNGTTITAMRTVDALRSRGHTVHVITGSDVDDPMVHTTGYIKWPILYQITKSQGMLIAKARKDVLRRVIGSSDIVHFLLPFPVERKGKAIADKLNIPTSAAFHLQPENITSTLHLNRIRPVNEMLYRSFRRFYNRFDHVHCPSNMIAGEMRKRDYTAKLHVISNGVDARFVPEAVAKPEALKDKFVILMIGRLSREKRQDLVVEAVKQSRHRENIQIIFAGKGPKRRAVRKMGEALENPPIIGFYNQDELHHVINFSDLYVHASDIEIEAISCIEAFSCGLVPVISDSPTSATNQFALDDRSLFEKGNADDLADKIDHFYDHPEERSALSKAYRDYAKAFSLTKSVDGMEAMFDQVLENLGRRR